MQIEIKKLPKSLIEITGEIPLEKFEGKRAQAVKNLAEIVEIDGFRKGMAPESVLIKKLGTMTILEEMAHLALNETYPEIVTTKELDVIGNPEITITKIAEGNPLGFKIVSAVVPDIELPNYKKIAEGVEKTKTNEVTDKDVNDTIENIRKERAKNPPAGGDGSEGQQPEINDEFAKSLGDFPDLATLKIKIKENLILEREMRAKEKRRVEIIDKIISEVKTEIPDILIESETEKLIARMKADVERMGLKFEDYLKNLKKTTEDFKKEWRGEGEKRAKIELTLLKIARIENIKGDNEKIDEEVKHVVEHYKGADESRARDYVTSLLSNEKVFEFLENQ